MKVALLLCSIFITGQVMAMSASTTEVCNSETHTLNNYPTNGYATIALTTQQEVKVQTASNDNSEDYSEVQEYMDVLYKTVGESTLQQFKTSDNCFDTYTSYTRKILTFSKTNSAAQKLGLKDGQTMAFNCVVESSFPNGNGCFE